MSTDIADIIHSRYYRSVNHKLADWHYFSKFLKEQRYMQYDNLTDVSLVQLEQAQNWQAKYRLITDWGKLIANKHTIRESQHLVKGCETSAWLMHSYDGIYHRFAFDSESRVINGLAALLLSLIDKKTTSELVQINVKDILRDVGLEKHITPSRNNGFKTIVERAFYLAGVDASL